jgi:hypothetical protein
MRSVRRKSKKRARKEEEKKGYGRRGGRVRR